MTCGAIKTWGLLRGNSAANCPNMEPGCIVLAQQKTNPGNKPYHLGFIVEYTNGD
jgi:hypothetical protein